MKKYIATSSYFCISFCVTTMVAMEQKSSQETSAASSTTSSNAANTSSSWFAWWPWAAPAIQATTSSTTTTSSAGTQTSSETAAVASSSSETGQAMPETTQTLLAAMAIKATEGQETEEGKRAALDNPLDSSASSAAERSPQETTYEVPAAPSPSSKVFWIAKAAQRKEQTKEGKGDPLCSSDSSTNSSSVTSSSLLVEELERPQLPKASSGSQLETWPTLPKPHRSKSNPSTDEGGFIPARRRKYKKGTGRIPALQLQENNNQSTDK